MGAMTCAGIANSSLPLPLEGPEVEDRSSTVIVPSGFCVNQAEERLDAAPVWTGVAAGRVEDAHPVTDSQALQSWFLAFMQESLAPAVASMATFNLGPLYWPPIPR
jgi:hypothetical protein